MGHSVCIAGSGPSLELLKIEFPSVPFFDIASYNIEYSNSLILGLMLKAPALLSVIKEEHHQVAEIVKNEKIDCIISDNRYGCYHRTIPSSIIIHQLSIKASVLSPAVNYFNKKFINRFTQCWVPDTADHRLSGQLSVNPLIDSKFIGPLSRITPHGHGAPSFSLLALVSGPEPHRTSFETLLAREVPNSGLSYRLVRGLPNEHAETASNTFNHLPAAELNALIEAADVVISRPGYSTIMDLAALKKKAIFVPTPGQTEQLYLAKELQSKKIAPYVLQHEFFLPAILPQLNNYTGFTGEYYDQNLLDKVLREFLD